MARVELLTKMIHLRNGLTCTSEKGKCEDYVAGSTFWNLNKERETCHHDDYAILYKGPAMEVTSEHPWMQFLVVDREDFNFAVRLMGDAMQCGRHLLKTEFPGIFISYYVSNGNRSYTNNQHAVITPDISAHFHSKLQYIHYDDVRGLQRLHLHSAQQRCRLARAIQIQRIAIIRAFPESASSILFDNPAGLLVTVHAETATITKYVLTPVHFRPTNSCYSGLPITYRGEPKFLPSVFRVITQESETTVCSTLNRNNFQLYPGEWTSHVSHPQPLAAKPTILTPIEDGIGLTFKKLRHTGSSGLYTAEDLCTYQKTL